MSADVIDIVTGRQPRGRDQEQAAARLVRERRKQREAVRRFVLDLARGGCSGRRPTLRPSCKLT
jgi:hypothetical protein